MYLIKIKPTNNSSRHHTKLSKSLLAKRVNFVKNLSEPKKASFGRSQPAGKISAWHKQRGAKKMYRPVAGLNSSGLYVTICNSYDPNKTSFTSVVFDCIKKRFVNHIATSFVSPGSLIRINSKLLSYKLGFRMQLKNIPIGSLLNNIGNTNKGKSLYAKSSGCFATLIQNDDDSCKITLPSGKIVTINPNLYATIGRVSNEKNSLVCVGKAGRSRNIGRRPIVRGIAMNPVDHPHGGRTNGGKPSVTPWGLPTKGGFYLKRRSRKNKLKKNS